VTTLDKPGYTHFAVDLVEALPTLAESDLVRQALHKKFGESKLVLLLSMMSNRVLEGNLGDELHDYLADEIANEAEIVWESILPGYEDCFPVQVKGYGGVYFVWALEYDNTGYFLSTQDAIDYIEGNWDSVEGRCDYRPDFLAAQVEQKNAHAYIEALSDSKVRASFAPPPPTTSTDEAFWASTMDSPLPEDVGERIKLIHRWLAEPIKPIIHAHGMFAQGKMLFPSSLLGEAEMMRSVMEELRKQDCLAATQLVEMILREGKDVSQYFKKPWHSFGYGASYSMGVQQRYKHIVSFALAVQETANALKIPFDMKFRIGALPFLK
jgi:hypothetical protein